MLGMKDGSSRLSCRKVGKGSCICGGTGYVLGTVAMVKGKVKALHFDSEEEAE
jgi:hypothetical protein